nr:unnamed protein product [Callosobruchus analis]
MADAPPTKPARMHDLATLTSQDTPCEITGTQTPGRVDPTTSANAKASNLEPSQNIFKLIECSRLKATSLVNDKVVTDSFLALVELEAATAAVIYEKIIELFNKYDIPLTNIIGFASDNESVMMGNSNGVKAPFQSGYEADTSTAAPEDPSTPLSEGTSSSAKRPAPSDIELQAETQAKRPALRPAMGIQQSSKAATTSRPGPLDHPQQETAQGSAANTKGSVSGEAGSRKSQKQQGAFFGLIEACTYLPNFVEDFARSRYNYFAHSAKRQHDLKEFQSFVEAEPHKMLRLSKTRWLSLQGVVSRILQQWDAFMFYFQAESLTEHIYGASDILNKLHDVRIKLYFCFLQHILKIVCKMNLEFQSESPRIHILIPTISMYYTMIFNFFLKSDIVSKTPLDRINPRNPDIFLKIEDIYLGAGFETLLKVSMHNLSKEELQQIRINYLNFYVTLCAEIRSRIDFSDVTLNSIANICDINKLFESDRQSIYDVAVQFPNIIKADALEDLNLKWRLLT